MRRLRTRCARDERGFMLVEVAIGAGLIALGLFGLISVLDSSRELVTASETRDTSLQRAELEIEKVRASAYADMEIQSAPSTSADAKDPDYHVNGAGTGYRPEHLLSSSTYETLVIDATCTPPAAGVAPTTGQCLRREDNFQDGDLSGTVHRYVTWNNADGDAVNDMKRVTVAVRVTQGDRPPVVLSTVVRDPV